MSCSGNLRRRHVLKGKSVVFLMSPGAGMVELVEASDPTGKEAE